MIKEVRLVAKFSQLSPGELPGLAEEPLLNRHAKPLLAAIDDVIGDESPNCLFQDVLRFVSLRDQLFRDAHSKLHKLVIEDRNPGLEACAHAHFVEPHEEQFGQAEIQIQVGY